MFASFGIVLAHIITPNYLTEFKIIFNGALAYFFFSSGFVCKLEKNLVIFLKKNFFGIIMPYLIMALVSVICGKYFPEYYPENTTVNDILYAIFIKGRPIIYGCGWFLICIFVIKLIFNLVLIITEKIRIKNIIYVLMIILSAYLADNFADKDMIFRFGQVCFAFIFYILGYLFSKIKVSEVFENKFLQIIIFLITKSASLYVALNYLGYTNIADCAYGKNIVLYTLMESLAIFSMLFLGKIFENIKIFAYLGKNNLWIYLLHPYILWFVEEMYCKYKNIPVQYLFSDIKDVTIICVLTYFISALFAIIISEISYYIKNMIIYRK